MVKKTKKKSLEKKGVIVKNEVVTRSPAQLITAAVQNNADLSKLEKLLELQAKWEAGEAKKAYNKAMAEFKANPPRVVKDKLNTQYKSKYTSLSNLANVINPELSKYGLSASWDIEQDETIKVVCRVTHVLGHSESVRASAPADESGSKNIIQQIKSTITYLKIVTLESICGLASVDGNADDDGNSHGSKAITSDQIVCIRNLIANVNANEAKVCNFLGADKLDNINQEQYRKGVEALNKKK